MFLCEVLCELRGKKEINHEGARRMARSNTKQIHPATNFSTIISSGKKIQIKKVDLLMSQPVGMTILEYANQNIGFQWESEVYGAGTNVELGIYWSYNHWRVIYEGNEAGAVIEQLNSRQYQIGYEAAGDDWDYNELVILVTIEDYELLLEIEPAVISAGEEATITVKKQYMDGRVEEFPAGQMFEAGMMEGCAAGGLINGTDTVAYINGITQPIKFVAADSLENEEETVRIGVGLLGTGEGVIVMKQKSENKIIEKMEIQEETNTELIIGEYCFLGNFVSDRVGEGTLIIEKGRCGNLSSCTSLPYPEFVQYKMVPSGLVNKNPVVCEPNRVDHQTGLLTIQTGGFVSLDWRFERSQRISAEPCFDSQSNKVGFNMVLTDVDNNLNSPILKPEAILEVCEDNISDGGLILINNTDELLSIIRQFPEQIPILKADMDSALSRYGASAIKYKFRQEIVAHETEHKKDYESWLSDLKPEMLDRKIMDYTLTCSKFKSNPYATEEAKVKYLSIVIAYIHESNQQASDHTDEISLHKRISIQVSLFEYYNLLYKFENGIIF